MSRTGGIEYISNTVLGVWSKSYVKKNSNIVVFGSVGGVLIPANSELISFTLQPLATVKNFIIQANYGAGESLGLNFDGEILRLPGITDGGGKNLDQKLPTLAFTKLILIASTAVTLNGFFGVVEINPNV